MTVRRARLAGLLLFLFPALAFGQSVPSDISGHWAEAAIRQLVARGIMEPFSDNTFRPDGPVTRGRFIAWLGAVKGLPRVRHLRSSFQDLSPSSTFSAQIESALAYGVIPLSRRFRAQAPITRVDAIHYAVRALGHTFESGYMATTPLPYQDIGGLEPSVRGAVAIATLSNPRLLREPGRWRLRPKETLTRAEAASLLAAYLEAIEQPLSLRASFHLAQGLTLVLEKRGALRTLPSWRVQIGAFQEPARAAALADSMRGRGFPVFVDLIDIFHKVRVGNFALREDAEVLAEQLAAEGHPVWIIETVRDFEAQAGPVWTGVVLIEGRDALRLRPAPASMDGMTRTRPSEIAQRHGAIAATNGGFFNLNGDPLGCLMVDGQLLSEPWPGRSCVGITRDGQVLFDVIEFRGSVTASGPAVTNGNSNGSAGTQSSSEPPTYKLNGVNRERGPNELVVYRRAFGLSTRTNNRGAEAVVINDVVQQVSEGRGNIPIPATGYVLSGHGQAASWLRQTLRVGDRVTLRLELVPLTGDGRWANVVHVLGGGPRLLADGQYVGGEGFTNGFTNRRHPRAAIARLLDGRILLMVVDGRQPYHSLGMTLPELATVLRDLGATDAVNLDGGGSATLVVRGVVINLPSDEGGERPVSDVLLVTPP